MEYPSDVEIVQALRKRIKELEDGACRFNCRTVKEYEEEIERLTAKVERLEDSLSHIAYLDYEEPEMTLIDVIHHALGALAEKDT